MAELKNKTLMAPIKIGIWFSVFTIILFEFGVYDYYNPYKFLFYVFLIVCNISMFYGFKVGVTTANVNLGKHTINVKKLISFLFWVSLLLAIPKYLLYTKDGTLSFGEIIARLVTFQEDAGSLYMEHNEHHSVTGIWRYINYLVILLSPLYWSYIPLSMYYWKRLRAFKKVGTIFIYFLYCAQYLVTGTNVGIFVFIVFLAVIFIINTSTSEEGKAKRKRLFGRLGIFVVAILAAVVLASFFNTTMGSRIGDNVRSDIDQKSIFWILTPVPLRNLLCYFNSYLAHAYQALAYSFTLPWDSTFGVGYSFYLLDEFDPSQTWLWPRTYNMKMHVLYHYDYYAKWHTPYVWFANDVSHFGVPIVLFFLFRLFGRAWRRFNESGNLISLLIFIMFVEFMMFISANNQIFQTNYTLITFWVLVVVNSRLKNFNWTLTSNEI